MAQRLAETINHEGMILGWGGQASAAEEKYRRAEALSLGLTPEQVDPDGNVAISLGQLYVNWGGVLFRSRRHEESINRSSAGLSRVEGYIKVEPNDVVARDLCLKFHGNRAFALAGLKRYRESAAERTRVLELSTQPVPPGYRIHLALALVADKRLDQALEQARLAQQASGIPGDDSYNLGCLFSLCATAARKDASVSPDQRAKLVESHISNALLQEFLAERTRETTIRHIMAILVGRFGSKAESLETKIKATVDEARLKELLMHAATCRTLGSFQKQLAQ